MTNTTKLSSLQIVDDNSSNPTSTFQVAKYTQTQIDDGIALRVEGNKIFNIDLQAEQIYANAVWQTISTAAAPTGELIAQSLATDPVAGTDGEIWLNSTENAIKSTVDGTVLYMNPKPGVLKVGNAPIDTIVSGPIFDPIPSGTFSVSNDFLFANSTNTSAEFVGITNSKSFISASINYIIDTTIANEALSFVLFIDNAEITSTINITTINNSAPNSLINTVNLSTIHVLNPNHKIEIYFQSESGNAITLAELNYSISVVGI